MSTSPLLLLTAFAVACAAHPADHKQPSPRPAVAETITKQTPSPSQNHSAPAKAINWRTRTYDLPPSVGELMEGNYAIAEGRGEYPDGSSVFVDQPIFIDVDRDGVDEAVMILVYDGGGSGKFSIGLVYSVDQAGKVSLLGHIPGGDRAHGGLGDLSAGTQGQILVERFESGGGACCPSHILSERWRWQGGSLKIDETKTARREAGD